MDENEIDQQIGYIAQAVLGAFATLGAREDVDKILTDFLSGDVHLIVTNDGLTWARAVQPEAN